MKNTKLLTLSLLAFAGTSIVLPLHAATTSYAAGDLLLSFRDTGGYAGAAGTATTEDYVVDLGNVTTVTAAGTHVLNTAAVGNAIGNIGADLTAVFGSQWYNDPNLFWNVSAVTGTVNNKTLYTTAQNPSTAWTSSNQTSPWGDSTYIQSNINPAAGYVTGIGGGFAGLTTSANTNFGAAEVIANDSQNYTSYIPSSAGGTGSSSLYFSLMSGSNEGNSATGVTANTLELYSVNGTTGSGLALGSLAINSSGQVTFSTSAVPEPGRASLMALGMGLLALRRRRQSKAKAQG